MCNSFGVASGMSAPALGKWDLIRNSNKRQCGATGWPGDGEPRHSMPSPKQPANAATQLSTRSHALTLHGACYRTAAVISATHTPHTLLNSTPAAPPHCPVGSPTAAAGNRPRHSTPTHYRFITRHAPACPACPSHDPQKHTRCHCTRPDLPSQGLPLAVGSVVL